MQEWFLSLGRSVIYPLRDNRWFVKSWPLPLFALIPFVALLAPILYKGWRLSAIRQLLHADNTLPELDLVAFFRRGLLLWTFTFLYLLVPIAISSLLGFGVLGLAQGLTTIGNQNAQEWATVQAMEIMWTILIYAVWALISLPVYQAGLVRYAISGSWRSMLNIPANTALFLRHISAFFMFYISWLVITSCVMVLGLLLTLTVVGVPLLPLFVLSAYYVTTAYELGHLARKISAKDTQFASLSLTT